MWMVLCLSPLLGVATAELQPGAVLAFARAPGLETAKPVLEYTWEAFQNGSYEDVQILDVAMSAMLVELMPEHMTWGKRNVWLEQALMQCNVVAASLELRHAFRPSR